MITYQVALVIHGLAIKRGDAEALMRTAACETVGVPMSEVATEEAEVRRRIAEEVSGILGVYYEIMRLLKGVPSNEELQQWLRHMERTLDVMKAQYVENYEAIDLRDVKRTHDPSRVFAELASRYREVERGFYSQIKGGGLDEWILEMFEERLPHSRALRELIAEIPASYAEI